jgi:hypothetical protein
VERPIEIADGEGFPKAPKRRRENVREQGILSGSLINLSEPAFPNHEARRNWGYPRLRLPIGKPVDRQSLQDKVAQLANILKDPAALIRLVVLARRSLH